MKKILLFCALLIPIIVSAKDKLDFVLDYSCFKQTGSDLGRVELYFSVPVKSLQYNDSLQASFSIKVQVFDGSKLLASDYFGQYSFLKSKNELNSGGEAPSQTNIELAPGTYRLKAVVTDLASKDSAVIEIPQASEKFKIVSPDHKMAVSNIQLSSKMVSAEKNSDQFVKNGMLIIPNPRKLFGTHNPFLSYYAELYNLQKDKDYRLNWEIYTSEGKFIRKGDQPLYLKGSESVKAVFDKVKIYYLKSGSYNFMLRLADQAGVDSVFRSNNFYIYRPLDFEKKVFATDSLADLFEVLPDDKIDDEYAQLSAVFSQKEQSISDQLNESGKRNFLKKYWQEKESADPDARNKFLYLVALADREYSTVNIKGWKTDRGRVLIKMGEPDKKDQLVLNKGTLDHEIWLYYSSNSKFVFTDSHGLGNYKLIHSDYPGEKSDPNWESKLKSRSGGSMDY